MTNAERVLYEKRLRLLSAAKAVVRYVANADVLFEPCLCGTLGVWIWTEAEIAAEDRKLALARSALDALCLAVRDIEKGVR